MRPEVILLLVAAALEFPVSQRFPYSKGTHFGSELSVCSVHERKRKGTDRKRDLYHCGSEKWLGSFEERSRVDLSGEYILLYCAVFWFRRQFLQRFYSGSGICHRPEHPERSGDQLRNHWKVHGKRNLHDCGDQIGTGFQCGLGQTEIRSRMDQSGLC